jgi:hypothetical protein
MDVILDSNAYLSDIRMESIKFKNLFDYLRRTKSSLVVPRLVREETVAKYKSLLEAQTKKTDQAVDQLNRLIIDKASRISFSTPEPKYEVRDLRKKFRAPAKGISVRYYPDTSGIDVSDVFLRGVKRRRPSSSTGEELRDVIVWLVTLQFAEQEKTGVALVTADKGFWNGTEVHEHIRQDIETRKVKVSLFHTIDDFIRSSAPAPVAVDAEAVSHFFDVRRISDAILAAASKVASTSKRIFWQQFSVKTAKLETAALSSGTLYQIDADTKLAELVYDLIILAELAVVNRSYFGATATGGSSPAAAFGNLFSSVPAPLPSLLLRTQAPYFSSLGSLRYQQQVEPEETTTLENYTISAKALVSVRLVESHAVETELDDLEILKAEKTDAVL